jgi:hypothetical protein
MKPNLKPETNTLAFVPMSDGASYGTLCVCYALVHDSEPKITVLHWPIVEGSRQHFLECYPELDTDTPLHDIGNGAYQFYRGNGSSPIARLKDGGQTQSIKTDTIDIPCPKVRAGIETRWYRGAWQKYLKSKGWVFA